MEQGDGVVEIEQWRWSSGAGDGVVEKMEEWRRWSSGEDGAVETDSGDRG
jgi:hypothetical protein